MKLRKPGYSVLAALVTTLFASALRAQVDNLFTPNFRDMDIQQVIQVIAEETGRSIITDPRVRGQQINFYNQAPMTAEELWQAFQQILQIHTFTAIESGGIWRIIPDAALRTEASSVTGGVGADVVTRTIAVQNVPASTLVPILRPMMPQNAQLGNPAGTDTLVLVDRADNLERIERIVEFIERSNAQEIDRVTLQFASAEDVTQKLLTLAQGQTTVGLALQAIADERTNSVILTGTPNQIARYRNIAESLDLPSTQGGGSQVVYLNYADATEIAENLAQQFGGAQVVEDAETVTDPTGGNVTVWADIATNSLVLAAPSSVMRDMLAIIERLDIPRAQVHVQAIIVEMSDSRAAELGLTWIVGSNDGDQVAALTNFSGTIGGILQLAQIGAGGTPDPNFVSDGVTAAVGDLNDSGTSWAAVVSALQGDGQTNVLSMPEIVVLDNAEASINVGQEVPFLTGQYAQTGAGAGGGINPFSTVDRAPVGTTLTLTPRINEGTGMRLSIEQVTSSISSSAQAVDIITNERSILTEVFVEDGDILVLGGLMDDQLRENEQRVPGLGRIPGLRWLFRARNTERSKSNLMVFIRPTILRDSLDASRMTTEKYRYLQEEQLRRAEEPVPLLKDVERPVLPPLEGAAPDPG